MLEGEISEIRLVERLVELWREQFTGAIRFESDAIIKIVYFKGGDILSASTNDRSDSIDEILMKAGKVTREHVKQALAKRKESETLGDALLNLGFITRKELTWARRVQVVGVIRSIAAWETGSFTIVADYLPKRDEGTLFPLPQVLVELIVTEQDRQQFERAMDGGNAVFEKTADFDDVFRRLGLNEDAEAIAAEIDGSQSASEVATSSGRDAFNVYKLLHALATLGVIRRGAKPQGQPQFSLDDFSSAGVADAADMWSEPEPAQPMFQLDEAEALNQPTLEVPVGAMGFDAEPAPEIAWTPDPEPEPVASQGLGSAWDDDEPVEETPDVAPPPIAPPPAAAAPMPAWDRPLVRTPVEPAPEVEKEPQWGFDEAQIETARRAAVPVASVAASGPGSPPPPERAPLSRPAAKSRKGSRLGLIVALLAIAILAAAGYYGWLWWQNREATSPAPVVATKRPAPRPLPATPPATATIVETTGTTATTDTATTATVAPATTTTVAATTTTAPPPTATETAALPVVKPKTPLQVTPAPVAAGAGRERLDAMAREYAANPSGNFTVQIQILCDPGNLGQAIATGGANVWFVPQTIGGRPCYRVFWGRYATRAEAQAGLSSVPAALRDRNAAVKPVPGR